MRQRAMVLALVAVSFGAAASAMLLPAAPGVAATTAGESLAVRHHPTRLAPEDQQVFRHLNDIRRRAGVKPLRTCPNLQEAVETWSGRIASDGPGFAAISTYTDSLGRQFWFEDEAVSARYVATSDQLPGGHVRTYELSPEMDPLDPQLTFPDYHAPANADGAEPRRPNDLSPFLSAGLKFVAVTHTPGPDGTINWYVYAHRKGGTC